VARHPAHGNLRYILPLTAIVLAGLLVGSGAALLAAPINPDFETARTAPGAATTTVARSTTAAGASQHAAQPTGAGAVSSPTLTPHPAEASPTISVALMSLALYGDGPTHDIPPCRPHGTQIVTNHGAVAAAWSIVADVPGLTISPSSGTLAPGASAVLAISYAQSCARSRSATILVRATGGTNAGFIVTY
jgi:hypothetical protein